jgi:hypothetical protein
MVINLTTNETNDLKAQRVGQEGLAVVAQLQDNAQPDQQQ